MHFYTENNAFPSAASLVDDTDAPNATNFNPGHEAALDRTAFTAKRLINGGQTSFWTGLLPADLTALTVFVDNETRALPGRGLYVYKAAATNIVDGEYVIASFTGVGRWLLADYLHRTDYRIQLDDRQQPGPSITLTTGAGNFLDPGGRHAGSTNGWEIIQTSTFTLKAGDEVEIAWSATVLLLGVSSSSDPVVGVAMNVAGVTTWPAGANERAFQTSADVVNGGTWNLGVALITGADPPATFVQLSRKTRFTVVTGGSAFFALAASLDPSTSPTGSTRILQGATMTVTQFRPVL